MAEGYPSGKEPLKVVSAFFPPALFHSPISTNILSHQNLKHCWF